MDVLAQILGGGKLFAGVPGPADNYWYEAVGAITDAGVRVDEQGAQKLSAWYRGRDILATVIAMTPFGIYQRLPQDGGSEPAPDHPLYDVLHDQPNERQDSFQWRREQVFDVIDHGHAYDWMVEGRRGFAHQLVPVEPTLVTCKQLRVTLANGAVVPGREIYDVRDAQTGRTQTYTQDEIFHLRGAGGKGILQYARESLGTALATESYAAQIFGRGPLNGGVIETPAAMDPEAAKAMAATFLTTAGKWHVPKVLEQGAKFIPNKMSPEDFQMLLSRKFSVDDIARWLGVPRQLLENSDPSFGNAEQFWQSFLTISMGGWLSLFEFAVNSQLILAPHKYFARFTRQAIARGDLAVRWTAHVAAVNAGIVTVDEVRGVEDLNKRGGKADELREPQNITGKPAAADPAADPTPAPPPKKNTPPAAESSADQLRARAVVTSSAERVLCKERAVIGRAEEVRVEGDEAWREQAFRDTVTAFYAEHHTFVMKGLLIDEGRARFYAESQRDRVFARGASVTETWTAEDLVGMALDQPIPDPLPGMMKSLIEKPSPEVHVPVTIAKGAVEAIVHAHAAPVTVHAPVTIDEGAVRVETPVTIQKGAIQHDTHLPPAAKKTTVVVQKKVTRDAKGQIASVTEEHREQD